jgi:hypothetical protein
VTPGDENQNFSLIMQDSYGDDAFNGVLSPDRFPIRINDLAVVFVVKMPLRALFFKTQ